MQNTDLTTALATLLGPNGASYVAAILAAGAVISHVLPWLPAPTATSPKWYSVLWGIAAKATGSYGNMTPK